MKHSLDIGNRLTTSTPSLIATQPPSTAARGGTERDSFAAGFVASSRRVRLALVAGALAAACSSTEDECAAWPYSGIFVEVDGAAEVCESSLAVEARAGNRVETLECSAASDGICSCYGAEDPGTYDIFVLQREAPVELELGTAGPVRIDEWQCDVGPRRVSLSVDLDAARATGRADLDTP